MKRFILIFLLFLLSIQVQAKIITGEVEYNADIAREETFAKPVDKISFDKIYNHFFDSNNIDNLNYLFKGITELNDRKLVKFSEQEVFHQG